MYGAIIFDYRELDNLPIWQLEKPLKEKAIAMKVITGYTFDNPHVYVSNIYGHLFAFSLHRTQAQYGSPAYFEYQKMFGEKHIDLGKVYTIYLWNQNGQQSLFSTTFMIDSYDSPIPDTVRREMENRMKRYEDGYIHCSDCGKEVPREPVGQYFAGAYCPDCWKGKTGEHKEKGGWKAVEAKETYD